MNILSILKRIIAFIIFFGTVFGFGANSSFSINDVTKNEGSGANTTFTFTVSLSGECYKNVTYSVNYATSNSTATAGSDYTSTSGTISIKPTTTGGCSGKTFNVTVIADTTYESDEIFNVRLSSAKSSSSSSHPVTISDDAGIGKILNDDTLSPYSSSNTRDYTIVKKANIRGDMKIIGNSIMRNAATNSCAADNTRNNNINVEYIDIDSNGATSNSTSAELNLPTGATSDDIVWAGLYWQGYYEFSDGYATHQAEQDASQTVKLKTPAMGTYTDVTADKFNWVYFGTEKKRWYYQGMTDVTDYVKAGVSGTTYMVADVKSQVGKPTGGAYGAWSIVVIYKNKNTTTKNITIFDGYVGISSSDNNGVDVFTSKTYTLSGFKTPIADDVNSKFLFFAGEGDVTAAGDYIQLTNKAGVATKLSDSKNPQDDIMNATVTDDGSYVDTRSPSCHNTIGIDIDSFNVGTNGQNIITNNQTSTQITLKSNGDGYFPAVFGFSTDLYLPKLCYDYSALLNGELMQKDATDRTFIPHKNDGTLQSKVFIRSLEGDFPYVKSSMKAYWLDKTSPTSSNPPELTFTDAWVQNPDVYAYEEAEYIDNVDGIYYIGTDKSGSGGEKGVIEPFKSLYAISNFDADKLYGSTLELNVDVTASLALDADDQTTLTEYTYSTSDGTLEVCPGTLTYNPMWYQFNIEKYNASPGDYALSTQVTGTDYTLQAVAYTKDGSGEYTVRTAFTGAIEVEPFEIPSFQSLGSYDENKYNFDRICEDSSNGKTWSDGQRRFSQFANSITTDLPFSADDNKYAMRNAGIRMWALVADYNGDGKLDDIVQNNNCINTSGTCFKDLYANDPYYKTVDGCDTECGSSSIDEECYQCLRKFYSQPICSRDNFSVRPYGVELSAKSKALEIKKNDTLSSLIHNLISGVLDDYVVEMVAKSANDQANPAGYYFRRISSDARDVVNSTFDTLKEFFGIKFNNTLVNNSGDITNCADSSHKRFDVGTSGWKLENDNVGNYDVVLVDKDWTLVDQARYPYKASVSTGRDDCSVDSTILSGGINGVGCDVQSFEVNSGVKFNKIPVKFVPAKIDIQSIVYGSYPAHGTKWVYMNNLDKVDSDYNMAAQFTGAMAAKNAKGDTVSNFTAGCMAQNVNLFTQYTTTQLDGKDVKAENTDGTILQGGDTIPSLHLAESFNSGSFSSASPVVTKSTEDTTDGSNYDDIIQTQASKDNFLDASLGNLVYDLRYNINKLYYVAVRPIEILFVKLSSALIGSDNLQVTAWRDGVSTNKIGEEKEYFSGGVVDIADNSFKFIYGRVYTDLERHLPNGKSVQDDSVKTKFNTLAYLPSAPGGILVNNGVLDTTAVDTSWYRVIGHSVNEADGQIDELRVISQEKGTPTISPSANVMFNSNTINTTGITPDVEIAYLRPAERSNKVVVQVDPSIWLRYNKDRDKNGLPEFAINFVDTGYNWVGKGKTGNVVNQPASGNAKNRLNW